MQNMFEWALKRQFFLKAARRNHDVLFKMMQFNPIFTHTLTKWS